MRSATPSSWLVRTAFRASRRVHHSDFEVRVFLADRRERERIDSRLSEALSLVRKFAPSKYLALQRDFPRILVAPSHGLGECHDAIGICLLQFDYILADATAPEEVALTLVHEGMHARLHRAGFQWTDAASRARHERLCSKPKRCLADACGPRQVYGGPRSGSHGAQITGPRQLLRKASNTLSMNLVRLVELGIA